MLLAMEAENEIVEFKEAKSDYSFDKIGQYFSALSNEANLKRKDSAWLVFGVEDKQHTLVGTQYRGNSKAKLNNLKKEIADKTTDRTTFIEIHEVQYNGKRVVMFQIPPAPGGIPIAFGGHWYARENESLVSLNIEKLERIRAQALNEDWSKIIVHDATLKDLDELAIAKARIEFINRNPKYKVEEPTWDNKKFLAKAKLTINGGITRTALILLGNEESEHYLDSAVKIRWNLKTVKNEDKDFEIFSIPFILAVDEIYGKIRNLKYRYLRPGTLFPDEVLRYDPFTIREPLNNAIAHQDYAKKARINVVEFEDDHLVFSNYGSFIPKSVEEVVLKDSPEELYRNPFLVEAMKNLGMIETQGGGIRKIFNYQRERLFPMPDYEIGGGKVKVKVTGKILNEKFAEIVIQNPNLTLDDILMLDKVQKGDVIEESELKHLRRLGLVEGRKKNLFLSLNVVEPLNNDGLKAEYIANRSFDDTHFKKMIVDYLIKFGKTKRATIDNLIIPKLSTTLTSGQKISKIKNYLSALRIEGKIHVLPGYFWEAI